uniref:NADH dehydrogenase subunit 7 n=1 Tax=Spirostomum yagiui TaxID=1471042 RepID=UPI0030018CD6|nr:NADH dehydrogenase subunit 7 [Spirostomum yagiui]
MNRDFFSYWRVDSKNNIANINEIKSFNLNFGPQHPASHGVLRMILQLRGEVIEKSDTHIGLLHRGTEKLIEEKNYLLSLPYFDRLDYVSVLAQEHAYCLAIENLLGTVNYQTNYVQIRVIFDELTRILNHLMAVSTHSLDVGCMAPVFWAFEEREKIMEFYERVSGARMHAAFYRPNDISINYITNELLIDIILFSKDLIKRLMMIENKLSMTSIWKYRLVNIGILDYKFVNNWGLSGVLARSAGLLRDLRLSYFETYANYYYLNIRSFIGRNGDCYDRYLIRMREMVESLNIISQVVNNLTYIKNNNNTTDNLTKSNETFFSYLDYITANNLRSNKKFKQSTWYIGMEELINHFKYYSNGLDVKKGVTYCSIEAPKGEFGVTLVSDGSNKPYRCKIRGASYYHLQALDTMVQGHFFSDLVTIIGSQDLVMGEVDR